MAKHFVCALKNVELQNYYNVHQSVTGGAKIRNLAPVRWHSSKPITTMHARNPSPNYPMNGFSINS